MFLQKFKNLFICLKNKNIQQAESHARELREIFKTLHSGGNGAFREILSKEVDPALRRLKSHLKNEELLLNVVNYIIKYIDELNIKDASKVREHLIEIKRILNTRLGKP